MSYSLYCGDCLEEMRNIPNKSVDLILCDLPYGFTDCEWDKIIPFEPLWKEYKRVLKIRGIVVLFGNQPFTSSIINSNLSDYSHMWYWKKNYTTGSLLAKQQPLRCIEDIVVFKCNDVYNNNADMHKGLRNYFYGELAKSGLKQSDIHKVLGNYMHRHYFCRAGQFNIPTAENYKKLQTTGFFNRPYADIVAEYKAEQESINADYTYNPQGIKPCSAICRPKVKNSSVYGKAATHDYIQTATGYPTNILEIKGVTVGVGRLHPTQKPVELLEYLIRTYSNEGETVLDNCMGSGSTGVACIKTNRNFIGIELDKDYFEIAKDRIEKII